MEWTASSVLVGLSRGSPGVSFRGRAAVLWCCEVSSNIFRSFFSCSVGSALEVFDGSENSRMLVFLQTGVWVMCQERESRWNGRYVLKGIDDE
jgi:hypothetical protein